MTRLYDPPRTIINLVIPRNPDFGRSLDKGWVQTYIKPIDFRGNNMESGKNVMTSSQEQLIKITPIAHQELVKMEATGESFLRISVIPGGCSGMTYSACIDNALGDDDQVIFSDGDLRVVSDAGSMMFLDGLEIDFSDDLIASGFRFKNPKAKKGCGCGSSFSV